MSYWVFIKEHLISNCLHLGISFHVGVFLAIPHSQTAQWPAAFSVHI